MKCINHAAQIIGRPIYQVDYSYLSNVKKIDPPINEPDEEPEIPRPTRCVSAYRLIVHTGSLTVYQIDYSTEEEASHAFETFLHAKSGIVRRVTIYKVFADSDKISIMEHMRTRSVR